ncbi:AIR synthase-related protein [Extibacter sp. GGCC_0201]|uniref:AIR synthase-related protein n=1 Tax=Extibacter sp. GGCC_0201 TaxID=2731209 RepID=UPI001AA17C1D|nr:AIR synthase-related protein [Extibacter sp. GGCC_0201]
MKSTDIQTMRAVSATSCIGGQSKEIGIYALAEALNELAAEGAESLKAQVYILIPEAHRSSRIPAVQKAIEKACREQGVPLLSIHQHKTPAASLPLVAVTCTGITERTVQPVDAAVPGGEIVLTGWIGLAGMLRIAEEREAELKERFAPPFVKQIEAFKGSIFAGEAIRIARGADIRILRQITEGGIFAALWYLAKEAGTGIDIDMKKISVRQETIEVCENYRLNPYQLTSTGSFLILAADGKGLAGELRRNGIEAAVIGRVTDNNDKVIRNGEEIRYIDRPVPDEINKIIGHTKSGN